MRFELTSCREVELTVEISLDLGGNVFTLTIVFADFHVLGNRVLTAP